MLIGLAVVFLPLLSSAASREDQTFSSASKLFDAGLFNLAETNFSNFLTLFTNSPHRADAILYLARSQAKQSNYDGALSLLQKWTPQAGALEGNYVFWTARTHLDKGDYKQAAEGFATVTRDFPNATRQLEAAYDEADAYSKTDDWMRVVDLLQSPDGAFRTLAAQDTTRNQFVTSGLLLLSEAFLAQGKNADGEKVLNTVDPTSLAPELQWRRQYLLCRIELAGGHAELALQNSTNLIDDAFGARHRAASRFVLGEILEKLGQTNDALQAYTNNLGDDLPPEVQRQALLKTIELTLAQNQLPDAVQFLGNYIAQRPHSPALDLARLSLGELYLRIYYSPVRIESTNSFAALGTNFLEGALTNFQSVLTDFPNSSLAAKAHLDRGWCFWAAKKMDDAKGDFQAAVDGLPFSSEQAVARFKLADSQLFLHDYGAAVTNYNLLLQQYAAMPSVTNGLFDQALYQIVEASLDRGDENEAHAAIKKILAWYPDSYFADRGLLLIGEDRKYDYAMARQVFNDLLKKSPHTPLLPEVQYAVARTYEQEGNWQEALNEYNQWVRRYPYSLLLPRVEFSRALAYEKAGMETNALGLLTNFVARFPSNSLAPWAQNWVADYYFDHEDYPAAERNYQVLYLTFPNAGDLPYQARLMAGRAALARQGVVDARSYFSDLVNNTNAPANLVNQGYFALGDAALLQFQSDPTNGIYMDDAIAALSKLTNGAPTNTIAAQAFGRLGDYYRQWADLKHDPNVYTNVVQMYQTVLSFPATNVDVATVSQAEVGLGQMAEREKRPDEALAFYCKVLFELDPEHFDPFWVEQAGVLAAHLCEDQQQWEKAIAIYRRVLEAVPSLRATLEKKIASAQSHIEEVRN